MKIDLRRAISGVEIRGDQPVKIRCRQPNHLDSEPSLTVWKDGLKCFGCGFRLQNTTEALSYLLYGHCGALTSAQLTSITPSLMSYREPSPKQSPPPSEGLVTAYQRILFNKRRGAVRWLLQRGIPFDEIINFEIGHTGDSYVIPVRELDGSLHSLRYRRDDTYGTGGEEDRKIPKYRGYRGRNTPHLYPLRRIGLHQPEQVWVVEGELDAVRLWAEGIPSLAITNGASQLDRLVRLTHDQLPFVRRLVMCGDQDEPGQKAVQQAAGVALSLGYEVSQASWPLSGGKDITEFLQRNRIEDVRKHDCNSPSHSGGVASGGDLRLPAPVFGRS